MPLSYNERNLTLYFTKNDGKDLKINVPAPKTTLTSAEVKTQMEAIIAVADLFDIVSIKDAGITERSVSDLAVE